MAVRPLTAAELDAPLEFRFRDRSRAATRVRLLHELPRPRAIDFRREHPGSWVLRLPKPDADRLEYQLELTRRNGNVEIVSDPANPLRAPGPFGDKSVIELAAYRRPHWLDEDAPPGELEAVEIESRTLRTTLEVPVWTATGGSPGEELPLLVAHDGPEYARYSSLIEFLDAAWAEGRIPTMRAALLPPPGNRNQSYSASALYARAFVSEILPALSEVAPGSDERERRIGMGASLGALALLHIHRRHPQSFGALYLQSGSYFRQRFDPQEAGFVRFRRITRFVGEILGSRGAEPIPVAMTCGTADENLANNRAVADALARQGYDVTLHEHRDAHNWVGWRDTFDPHLSDLLREAWT